MHQINGEIETGFSSWQNLQILDGSRKHSIVSIGLPMNKTTKEQLIDQEM